MTSRSFFGALALGIFVLGIGCVATYDETNEPTEEPIGTAEQEVGIPIIIPSFVCDQNFSVQECKGAGVGAACGVAGQGWTCRPTSAHIDVQPPLTFIYDCICVPPPPPPPPIIVSTDPDAGDIGAGSSSSSSGGVGSSGSGEIAGSGASSSSSSGGFGGE